MLVLDEPTNDLDLETLELLEAQLVEWPGTLLLVSHDRAFLDNVVTSTFVFEGDGRDRGVRRRLRGLAAAAQGAGRCDDSRLGRRRESRRAAVRNARPRADSAPKKLSYRDRRELEELPARIEALEAEQRALGGTIADPLVLQAAAGDDCRGARASHSHRARARRPVRALGRARFASVK